MLQKGEFFLPIELVYSNISREALSAESPIWDEILAIQILAIDNGEKDSHAEMNADWVRNTIRFVCSLVNQDPAPDIDFGRRYVDYLDVWYLYDKTMTIFSLCAAATVLLSQKTQKPHFTWFDSLVTKLALEYKQGTLKGQCYFGNGWYDKMESLKQKYRKTPLNDIRWPNYNYSLSNIDKYDLSRWYSYLASRYIPSLLAACRTLDDFNLLKSQILNHYNQIANENSEDYRLYWDMFNEVKVSDVKKMINDCEFSFSQHPDATKNQKNEVDSRLSGINPGMVRLIEKDNRYEWDSETGKYHILVHTGAFNTNIEAVLDLMTKAGLTPKDKLSKKLYEHFYINGGDREFQKAKEGLTKKLSH